MRKKIVFIFTSIILVLLVFAIAITTKHPILIKWASGTARCIGKPVNAMVYTNGALNKNIKVFHSNKYWNGGKADYFILYVPYAKSISRLKFFSVNRKDRYIGLPASNTIKEYDIVAKHLFQGEVGGKFTPITDDMKGYNFDPRIAF